jgi:hypothetical protein
VVRLGRAGRVTEPLTSQAMAVKHPRWCVGVSTSGEVKHHNTGLHRGLAICLRAAQPVGSHHRSLVGWPP